ARFVLDRALQPINGFSGFDVVEQFQTSAIRYQIFFMLYVLNVLQYAYTPNFHGHVSEAQRNLIEKTTLRRVWCYWVSEAMWGRLSRRTAPVVRDNIMLTGWFSIGLNLYMANSGDHRYAEPGSLNFRLNERISHLHDP